jgi:hypothetical protein
MTGPSCSKTKTGAYKKHTPIVSKAQRGLFGAELTRRHAGKKSQMKDITAGVLRSHLTESKGKNLPKYVKALKRKRRKKSA